MDQFKIKSLPSLKNQNQPALGLTRALQLLLIATIDFLCRLKVDRVLPHLQHVPQVDRVGQLDGGLHDLGGVTTDGEKAIHLSCLVLVSDTKSIVLSGQIGFLRLSKKALPQSYFVPQYIAGYLPAKLRRNIVWTYEVWKLGVSSCLSCPDGLIVKIRDTGIPTAR